LTIVYNNIPYILHTSMNIIGLQQTRGNSINGQYFNTRLVVELSPIWKQR